MHATHQGHLAGEGRRVVAPPCPRYIASVQRCPQCDFLAVRFYSSVNFLATIWPLIEIISRPPEAMAAYVFAQYFFTYWLVGLGPESGGYGGPP